MVQTMKRIVLIGVAAIMLATWALPAYAAPFTRDPGPAGSRWISEARAVMYCDNFYDGPPMATKPNGEPWADIQQQQVYWCYSENEGYWIPTSATIQ